MRVKEFGKEFTIPEAMINEFMGEFRPMTEPGERNSLEHVREMTGLVLETLRTEPELMEDKEYEDDYIRAVAMREALARFGILYDA